MKKLLPNTSNNRQGFTLVELMIVISIIAILAVVGLTIFSGTQSRARDARRQSDIQAIEKALEAYKVPNSPNYPQILPTWFAGGVVPTEGVGYVPQYSIIYGTTAGTPVAKPVAWASNVANPPVANSLAIPAAGLVPPAVPAYYTFQVCALLENPAINPGNIFCIPSSQ